MSTHYTFVSPTVAIGDIYSSYDDFDVIVNLSNNAKVDIGNILFEKVESRQIVHIGLIDRLIFKVEWTARLDFLWQLQAREEKLDMEALQGSNRYSFPHSNTCATIILAFVSGTTVGQHCVALMQSPETHQRTFLLCLAREIQKGCIEICILDFSCTWCLFFVVLSL